MKLRLLSLLMQAVDLLLAGLHRVTRWIERPLTSLRCWAWIRCTKENANKLRRQAMARTLSR